MMSIEELNPEQKRAVACDQGPLMIVAGPGTGKTKTLTAKIIYFLKKYLPAQAGPQSRILALTFTCKAAQEIKERLPNLLPKNCFIGTFHGFASSFLDKLKIISEDDLAKKFTKKNLLLISRIKNLQIKLPADFKTVFNQYQNYLTAKKLIDYDDLLILLLKKIKSKKINFDFILIDEFQDTNLLQYQIVKQLAKNCLQLCVIGDPKQAIYAFRGSDPKIFAKFKTDFSNCREIKLTQNYRSTSSILSLMNSLYPQEQIQSSISSPSELLLIKTFNEYSEADWIVEKISQAMGGLDLNQRGQDQPPYRFKDFAIIYRSHRLARILEEKFFSSGIPYQQIGDNSLFEQAEIKLLIQNLQAAPSSKLSPAACLETLISNLNLKHKLAEKKNRLLKLQLFLQLAETYSSVTEFLKYLKFLENHEYHDPLADKVILLTMHAAKGLEFKNVFVLAFEDGFIPLQTEEEEKRLFYVALSRAKDNLYLLKSQKRYGQKTKSSPFQTLIDKKIKIIEDEATIKIKKKIRQKQEKARQSSLFS